MKIWLLSLLLFFGSFYGFSQPGEGEVSWEISHTELGDNTLKITLNATLAEGWSIYAISQDEKSSVLASKIIYENNEVKVLSTDEIGDMKSYHDKYLRMDINSFAQKVDFVQEIEYPKDINEVNGTIRYQICNDEACIPKDFQFSIAVKSDNPTPATITSTPNNEEEGLGLLGIFLLAFGIGLAAIFTPCVYPIMPLTVSFFLKNPNKKSSMMQALFFGLSIIVIYVLIGVLFSFLIGEDFANILATHWVPNLIFFIVFILFSLSFFGMFEIIIPSWLVNKSDKVAEGGGLLGPFFIALTLVLVSFSCTGPLAGAILINAAKGDFLAPTVSMLGFASAFALFFTILALSPTIVKGMPKSGGWLNSVKVVFGFLELAFAIKFLSQVDLSLGADFLTRDVNIALWVVIFGAMGFYLLGKIRFKNDSPMTHVPVLQFILALLSFTFALYLIPGLFGAPLKMLSGLLHPQNKQEFSLTMVQNLTSQPKGTVCDAPVYEAFLKMPPGFTGYFEYEQGMACAKELKKPVFIDFTGKTCANCRRMEENVWSDPKVKQLLQDKFVIIALYEDVYTDAPKENWIEYKGETVKQIGKINRILQTQRYGFYATPYYAILDNKGNDLAKPVGFNLNVDEFVAFLEEGIANYKAGK